MIDACDPKIAGWSADGTSFLVRDTDRLAKVTIPQYFKHNKWSSFVRQLNFYGFKKVKSEAVTLEEEEQLEGTVRFRHDSFLRGRPDLLVEIQRRKMLVQQQPQQLAAASGTSTAGQQQKRAGETGRTSGATATDGSNAPVAAVAVGAADVATKSEVKALRDRIAAMSRNINDLSAMVQNMHVRDAVDAADAAAAHGATQTEVVGECGYMGAGSKRKKVGPLGSAHAPVLPESVQSSSDEMLIDELAGVAATEGCKSFDPAVAFTPANIFPCAAPSEAGASRQASMSSSVTGSDGAFVDDLFAFNEEGLLDGLTDDEMVNTEKVSAVTPPTSSRPPHKHMQCEPAAPDPKLMKELTDALTLLPKEMQDTLVNRMISTIVGAGPDSLRSQLKSSAGLWSGGSSPAASRSASPKPMVIVESDEKASTSTDAVERKTVVVAATPGATDANEPGIALQIDSAMFNSLVQHLAKAQGGKATAGKTDKILPPTVFVH